MKSIIERNLEKILSQEEGGMMYSLREYPESFGGNGGKWKDYYCGGANFYYNNQIGEIIYFGNSQNVPEEITSKFHCGTYRIALNINAGFIFPDMIAGIVDILYDEKPMYKEADKIKSFILKESANAFNKVRKFEVEF